MRTAGMPAHPIGDEVEPEPLIDQVAVLVVAADAPDVGRRPCDDPHWAPSLPQTPAAHTLKASGSSEMPISEPS